MSTRMCAFQAVSNPRDALQALGLTDAVRISPGHRLRTHHQAVFRYDATIFKHTVTPNQTDMDAFEDSLVNPGFRLKIDLLMAF